MFKKSVKHNKKIIIKRINKRKREKKFGVEEIKNGKEKKIYRKSIAVQCSVFTLCVCARFTGFQLYRCAMNFQFNFSLYLFIFFKRIFRYFSIAVFIWLSSDLCILCKELIAIHLMHIF